MHDGPSIVLIVPLYNSAKNVELIIAGVNKHLFTYSLELFFIDDASQDDTWKIILDKKEKSKVNIRALQLSQNVGQQKALILGLQKANTKWAILLDDDKYDNIEDLKLLISAANDNKNDLVYAYAADRQITQMRKYGSELIGSLMKRLNIIYPFASPIKLINLDTLRFHERNTSQNPFLDCELYKYAGSIDHLYINKLSNGPSRHPLKKLMWMVFLILSNYTWIVEITALVILIPAFILLATGSNTFILSLLLLILSCTLISVKVWFSKPSNRNFKIRNEIS